jgi:hypothetical protein
MGEPGVSLTHDPFAGLARSQGGVPLGPEQGDPGIDFTVLGTGVRALSLLTQIMERLTQLPSTTATHFRIFAALARAGSIHYQFEDIIQALSQH